MRLAVRLVLITFLFFLATPTLVSVIKKTCNTSSFFNMSEEELSHKEVKAEFKFNYHFEFPYYFKSKPKPIVCTNILKHDAISTKIFIPPPERI